MPGSFGSVAGPDALVCPVPGVRRLAVAAVVAVVTGAGLVVVAVAGQGGLAARAARVLRRRLRVFGGRPLAARREFSSCRVFQAARMRWLRTTNPLVRGC